MPFGIKKHDIFGVGFSMIFLINFFVFGSKMGPKSIIPDVTLGILFRYFSRPFSKVVLGRLGDRFLIGSEDSGRILKGFLKDFGRILGIC